MFKRSIFLFVTLVLVISIFGCSKDAKNEKFITVGIVQTLPSLDPAMHRDRTVESVLRNMFDCLTTRDASMGVAPQLAESWQTVDDLTWQFKLRNNVKFHNGDQLTVQDVKFTIDRIINPNSIGGKSSPRKGLIDPVVSAEVVDDSNILIKTSEPWPILPVMLTFIEIVPKGYVM
jgi:peptide/nickel transport system substrate-binding protein